MRWHSPAPPDDWGIDAVWSDDFHHEARRGLAGDADGAFADFDGSASAIARAARIGWACTGQFAPFFDGPRGTDPAGTALSRFVFFIQNHDQVGNRAFGDRLHHAIEPACWRAVSALLLLLPETPLIFMGQEWAARTPFMSFTDHEMELGRRVTDGRRREFSRFRAFADPTMRERIPDPQGLATFRGSRIDWDEREREPHASVLRLYRRLLALRREFPASAEVSGRNDVAAAVGPDALVVGRNREVGGEPARFGRSPEEFHHSSRVWLEQWPLAMLATSTHDGKRDENARARIVERMRGYLLKVVKEEKTRTSWVHPEMEPCLSDTADADRVRSALGEWIEHWEDGRIKLILTAALLRLRRRLAPLFLCGGYEPLEIAGQSAGHLLAVARVGDGQIVIALAPRPAAALCGAGAPMPVGSGAWKDTVVTLPDAWRGLLFRNVLTGLVR